MHNIMMPLVWLGLAIILVIFEAITVSLTCIWFAIGAFVAIIPACFNAPLWCQILVFLVGSALSFTFTRKFFKDIIKVKKEPTNADSLIGTDGIVTANIDNLEGAGKVYISGLTWSARSDDGSDIPSDTIVTVQKIEGATLVVKTKSSENDK